MRPISVEDALALPGWLPCWRQQDPFDESVPMSANVLLLDFGSNSEGNAIMTDAKLFGRASHVPLGQQRAETGQQVEVQTIVIHGASRSGLQNIHQSA